MSSLCVICSTALPATTAACPSLACFACVNATLGLLSEIELIAPTLDDVLDAADVGRGGGANLGVRRPAYGPREPIDLALLAALDYRTVPTEDDPVRSVLGSLTGINNVIRDHRGERHPVVPLLNRELAYLRAHLTWCATRTDFPEVVADIRDLRHNARLLTRRDRPHHVGRCPRILTGGRRCAARLDAWPDDDAITCPACRATWDPTEYADLRDRLAELQTTTDRRARRLVDRATLSRATGRSENTIRKHLEPACFRDADGAAMYDATIAVRLLATIHTRTRTNTPTRAGR